MPYSSGRARGGEATGGGRRRRRRGNPRRRRARDRRDPRHATGRPRVRARVRARSRTASGRGDARRARLPSVRDRRENKRVASECPRRSEVADRLRRGRFPTRRDASLARSAASSGRRPNAPARPPRCLPLGCVASRRSRRPSSPLPRRAPPRGPSTGAPRSRDTSARGRGFEAASSRRELARRRKNASARRTPPRRRAPGGRNPSPGRRRNRARGRARRPSASERRRRGAATRTAPGAARATRRAPPPKTEKTPGQTPPGFLSP